MDAVPDLTSYDLHTVRHTQRPPHSYKTPSPFIIDIDIDRSPFNNPQQQQQQQQHHHHHHHVLTTTTTNISLHPLHPHQSPNRLRSPPQHPLRLTHPRLRPPPRHSPPRPRHRRLPPHHHHPLAPPGPTPRRLIPPLLRRNPGRPANGLLHARDLRRRRGRGPESGAGGFEGACVRVAAEGCGGCGARSEGGERGGGFVACRVGGSHEVFESWAGGGFERCFVSCR
ncbi:hypothetical protein EJ03DRAFT_81850, partial [Teratosphaeria nubilosa]